MNEQSENPIQTSIPAQSDVATTALTAEEKKDGLVTRYKSLIALLAGVIVAVGGYYGYEYMTVPVAAVVNGEKITVAELEENVAMMMKGAELQGIDVNDPAIQEEVRTQALTNLVNNELLLGAARRAGVGNNEAAVQSAYNDLVTELGGEETLKERMATVGLSPETLMSNISDRLTVDAYIEAETDIENTVITDEEIGAYLAQIQTDGVTLPPLEEIRPQIEATLIAEKQQAIVDALLEKLRSEAKIEMTE
jgi:hypothetical protein